MRFIALLGSFTLFSVEVGIRSMIFAIPVALVARGCDVPASWKSVAFVMFCIFWHDCAFGTKDPAERGDRPAVKRRKAAAEVMTPAQVAAEARKLMREPKSRPAP